MGQVHLCLSSLRKRLQNGAIDSVKAKLQLLLTWLRIALYSFKTLACTIGATEAKQDEEENRHPAVKNIVTHC